MTQTSPERLAVFGGTFDPPHVGHVLAAHYVLLTGGVSRVLVVPCAQHPFGKNQISFAHRLAMTRLAFRELGDSIEILDIEDKRSGMSYTIDTVRELMQIYPHARLELILGSDNLADLDKWKDIEELKRLIDFRILSRLEENAARNEKEQETSFYLPRISSSTIREMIAAGQDAAPHAPASVLQYIKAHNLYAPPSQQEK